MEAAKRMQYSNHAEPQASPGTESLSLHLHDGESTPKTAANEPVGPSGTSVKPQPKSAKEVQKERSKLAKHEKFLAKKAKQQNDNTKAVPAQKKEVKVKRSVDVDAYEPKKVEEGRYEWWEGSGLFKPQLNSQGEVKAEGKFVIPIPPPNVTGSLHMGHALTNALQDTMIRHARMKGKTTVWIPGCDHASISTQSVVEKMLWKTKSQSRHDVGRSKLLEMIWDWTLKYKGNITNQLKRLGGSMDWSREAFTMDENLSEAVRVTFIQLFEEGIIYRANRLVNWCSAMSTSLSNLEVDNKDLPGKTAMAVPGYQRKIDFGVLTYWKYPIGKTPPESLLTSTDFKDYETIEIATTRPETMLGDTAIAVHPSDSRYAHLVGRTAIHPFIPGRKIVIIADDEVDPAFGTGAVKITPAHDPADFIKGKKHNLEFINILNDDGTLNSNAGPFCGQKRFDARYSVVQALKDKGLFSKTESHAMTIPLCQRTKDVVEPVLKPQWWMKMDNLAKAADEAVSSGQIKIKPESEEKRFHFWMQNIQDWCLSRQLWWGHRIPAYLVKIEGKEADSSDNNQWICARNEAEAREKAEKKFPGKEISLHWDEDVLDTWFSSGLWPWAILGWPRKTSDFESFYPTSILETGWDILFFWVARMIMLGIKMTGKVPFTEVYCHSLIRDSEGRKMSKSLGNVIDPLDIINGTTLDNLYAQLLSGNLDPHEIERASAYQKSAFPNGIPECGTDALRFSLINYTTGGGDIAFDIKEIEAKRRFCNKVYQATNYVLKRLGDEFEPHKTPYEVRPRSLAETWILHQLNLTAVRVTAAIESREFSVAAGALYQFWMSSFCDTFVENSKPMLVPDADEAVRASTEQTLYTALEGGLLLMHPIMPYITECLWQKLPRRPSDETQSIMVAKYPEHNEAWNAPQEAKDYEFIMEIAEGIRSLLAQYNFKEPGEVLVATYSDHAFQLVTNELVALKSLGGKYVGMLGVAESVAGVAPPKGYAIRSITTEAAVYVKTSGRINFKEERAKREQNLDHALQRLQKSQAVVAQEGWNKASKDVQKKETEKLENATSEVSRLEAALKELERLELEA